jgi:hypothetical protein
MMMVTIIVNSYSEFREAYGKIIRGDNSCDLNAEIMFLEFRIWEGWSFVDWGVHDLQQFL